MLDDIKDSIKAKLYDFTYTPFMSSVLISWAIINHKYLLIYFSSATLAEKLIELGKHDFALHCCRHYLPYADNVFLPITFGLFYVYGYPRISKEFYEYTLKRTKELKSIKQFIEDETPMTLAEAREIRKLASTLEEEKDKALRSLSKKDEEWQLKLDNALGDMNVKIVGLNSDAVAATVKIAELEAEHGTLQNETANIQTKLIQSNQFLESKNDECEQLKVENAQLKKQIYTGPRLPLGDDNNSVNEDIKSSVAYLQVMQYLHDDFDPMPQTNLIEKIVKVTGLGKTLIRHIINVLIDDKILAKNTSGVIIMTKEGTGKILEYIEKNHIPF